MFSDFTFFPVILEKSEFWYIVDLTAILSLLQRKTQLFFKLAAQKMKFSIKDLFSKCNQIRKKLRIWSHLLKKSLMENFIFLCSVCSFYCCLVKEG